MEEETKNILRSFIEATGTDSKVIKEKWVSCEGIPNERVKLIAIGVIQTPGIYDVYKKWSTLDLTKHGIDNFAKFWQDSIRDNMSKITNEDDAINVMHNVLYKKMRNKTMEFDGIIISEGRKRDNFKEFIELVRNMYKDDPEAAMKIGLDEKTGIGYIEVFNSIEELRDKYPQVEPKITPDYFVDNKIIIPIGKKNIDITYDGKKFQRENWYNGRYDGKPVVGSAYMKSLGIIARPSSGKYSKFDMVLNDEMCNISIPLCKHVKFYATISPSNKTKLNTPPELKFEIIGDGDFDIAEIDDVLKNMLLDFDNVLDYVKNRKDSQRWDIKAVWAKVVDAPPTEGNRYMVLTDTKEKTLEDMANMFDDRGEFKDTGMHCPIPEDIDVNFGEGSKILVFGTPRYGSTRTDKGWEEDRTKASMWVSGIFVPKDERREIQQTINVTDDELQEDFSETESPNLDGLDEL